jgi:hypothetical protein
VRLTNIDMYIAVRPDVHKIISRVAKFGGVFK